MPAVTLVFNLTHCINGIFYSSFAMKKWNGINVLILQKGIWYYIESCWRIVLSVVTVFLYARTFSRTEGIRKMQGLILLILSAFGFLLSVSSLLTTETSPVDLAVLLLSASSILMFATLFKYELFDLIPLAYSQLFNGTDYPVIVLSNSMSVVKANEAAKRMLPQIRKCHAAIYRSNRFFRKKKNSNRHC